MFYITQTDERPDGYFVISESAQWVRWLRRNLPEGLHPEVSRRLTSNLKHLLAGLELKAALIEPHANRRAGERPVLFEPYFQNFILEFCIGTFSVLEGLGSAHWLALNGLDGGDGPAIYRNQWQPVLTNIFDANGEFELNENVDATVAVRDKLHQDRLGARENIDWHSLTYDVAFAPARRAIATLLLRGVEFVPDGTNLR